MRKITQNAIAAFKNGKNFKDGNTEVESNGDITYLILYGNIIARTDWNADNTAITGLSINLCGWNTKTTQERLNGLPNVSLNTKKGQAFLNGKPIPSDGWVFVK